MLSPIIVNSRYEIIDGQHRFQAAKDLCLPIYYILRYDYGLAEVQLLNTCMKNWSKIDYLNAYCDLGHPEYLKFREFMSLFPDFGINSCQAILTNKLDKGESSTSRPDLKNIINERGELRTKYFQEGLLIIPNYNKSILNAQKIMQIKPFYDGFYRTTFVSAMIGLFKLDNYVHDRLLNKLSINPTALKHCVSTTQYKQMLEDVYNYKSRDKVSLRF